VRTIPKSEACFDATVAVDVEIVGVGEDRLIAWERVYAFGQLSKREIGSI